MKPGFYRIEDERLNELAKGLWDSLVACPHNGGGEGRIYGYSAEDLLMQFGIRYCPETGTYQFTLGATLRRRPSTESFGRLLSFSLQYMPACCGITLFHSFEHAYEGFSQDQFNEFMSALWDWIEGCTRLNCLPNGEDFYPIVADRRISLIMVSREDYGLVRGTRTTEGKFTREKLRYPMFYNWLETTREIQSINSFYNTNSGNCCHQITALL